MHVWELVPWVVSFGLLLSLPRMIIGRREPHCGFRDPFPASPSADGPPEGDIFSWTPSWQAALLSPLPCSEWAVRTWSSASSAGRIADPGRGNEYPRRPRARGNELIEQSRRDAEQIVRDAELKARDEAFRRREELTPRTRNRPRRSPRTGAPGRKARGRRRAEAEGTRPQGEAPRGAQGEDSPTARRLLEKKTKHLDEVIEQETKRLHEITGLSREAAEKMLLERLERELSDEIAAQHPPARGAAEGAGRGEGPRDRRRPPSSAGAAEHTASTTVSTVDIPSDDMKGRIIGREGRNIRTFEKATGVDVIVDDTPGVVIVSAFDNVRRETARLALTKLIQDGRIHPTRIEEVVAETQAEMEKHIAELGKQAVLEADVPMPHEKLVYLLGRLRFRTSYSQNVLRALGRGRPPVRPDGRRKSG